MWATLAFACLLLAGCPPAVHSATFSSTAYGPPWGGINGGGMTATGVNLAGSPVIHGVAVDPRVIPLGSRIQAWPNPWRCRRCVFTAFDTGGAIRGYRLDFYHPSRAVQLGWGQRTVRVWRVVFRSRASVTPRRVDPARGWRLRDGT